MSKPTKYVNAAKFGSCEIEPTTSTYIYMLAAKSHLESSLRFPNTTWCPELTNSWVHSLGWPVTGICLDATACSTFCMNCV